MIKYIQVYIHTIYTVYHIPTIFVHHSTTLMLFFKITSHDLTSMVSTIKPELPWNVHRLLNDPVALPRHIKRNSLRTIA